jgi:hypothetical protein
MIKRNYLNIVPGECIAVLAVGGIPQVQVGQDLDGEVLLDVRVRLIAF